jgi:flagellar biosynthesis chaperone FliJ
MYPKKITLHDLKLKKLLTEKGELIKTGIATSEEIEKIEADMAEVDKEVQEHEKAVDISDLTDKQKEISETVDKCIEQMEAVRQQIYDRLITEVPKEIHDKYDTLKNTKELLETERNKIAIKAQKYTDKIIPLGRKLMTPFLTDKYDDYDTIRIEEDEVVATIFNHIEEYKKNFDKNDSRKL